MSWGPEEDKDRNESSTSLEEGGEDGLTYKSKQNDCNN